MIPDRHIKKSKNGKYRSVQGKFKPRNPDKITNTNKEPVFKSRLEFLAFNFMDRSPDVIEWSYEPFAIWYIDPTKRGKNGKKGKKRRYFIDIVCKVRKSNGDIKKCLIEVKHSRETVPPKKSSRKSDRNKRLDEATYQINCSKWNTARSYCKKMGYEFIILTEKELK